jgi:hypothetical protein
MTNVIRDITEDFVYDLSTVDGISQNYQLIAEAYDLIHEN